MRMKTLIASSVMTLAAVGTVTAYAATNTNSTTPTASHTNHKFHRGGVGSLESIAKIIDIDSSTLQSDLKSGQSLAQIAQAKGIDEQTLISDIESAQKSKLDQAVSNGKLTSAQEQQILTKLDSRVQQLVEQTGGFSKGMGGKAWLGKGRLADLATIIGVDQATLQSDLKSGESLAQIAQSKGLDEQTLISDIESAEKAQLDKLVQSGKLTSAQEQKILSKQDARITQLVENPGFQKGVKTHHSKSTTSTTSTQASS
ncbi:hypothetical protein NZD89_08215 [Alicyclobacillus fastidiosus]|uniref:LysM domain-containing protein n=1 Tax=Alicyclobacillus fastidiosus TaxID=392011 RepID=A0ABY6ZML1_9BACL|nr:hypothetical protein [Alicyclobacillus fastidiosus]WAH43361.1 hypothetical protein NZD89_08215 [Alicyclobacillus fastidiosus]GMA65422.1 hypothetical protein GCM10025859_58620 [Alicyclobacillus fastidiosus]